MSFNLFGPADKNDIRVGYISTTRGYVGNISRYEANLEAKLNPGTQFILRRRDKIEFMNINKVNELTPKDFIPTNSGSRGNCSGITGLDIYGDNGEIAPSAFKDEFPKVLFSGGGGLGATAEATIRNGRIDQIEVKDPGAGYSSEPSVTLKSSFNYVINLDLNLLQFSFPHGITNGAPVTVQVVDDGSGVDPALPISSFGRLSTTTTYYAISGITNSLEDDQLRLALTQDNANIGDF